jgi:hypothetical protein
MKLEKKFDQTNLIYATGKQFEAGICSGLVVQWLISNSRFLNGEGQFWDDLYASTKQGEAQPLTGVGYAAKANTFYKAFSTEVSAAIARKEKPDLEKIELDLTRQFLQEQGILFSKSIQGVQPSPFGRTEDILKIFHNDAKYKILCIYGADWGHSIGVYNPTFTLGNTIHIFDPNIGMYVCDGPADALVALGDISSQVDYSGGTSYYTLLFN